MSVHPLLDRTRDAAVRQSRGFREAAAAISGADLNADFEGEERNAPRRGDAGKRYCPGRTKAPKRAKEEELLLAALCRRHGDDAPLERPEGAAGGDGGSIALVEYQIPLQAKAPERGDENDPNQGVGKVALLGVSENGRLVVFDLKYIEADARRTRTGDTPLRSLLQSLAHCAIVHANRDSIAAELEGRTQREVNLDLRPELVVLGTPRYWELCRKREAQKGAAWIQQMDRLAGEIGESVAMPVSYLALRLRGDPILVTGEDEWPALNEPARLLDAWDEFAGRIKPKPKSRPKSKTAPEDMVVEADLERPIRAYGMREVYYPGDRIDHPSLGLGIVQGAAGATKMRVMFGEDTRVLVHARA